MLCVLSPAKSLDESPLTRTVVSTQPMFSARAAELIKVLRTHSVQDIAALMNLSDALADLNVARYRTWRKKTPQQAKPALLMFDGDVYDGLQARTLDDAALAWAQDHVGILSGLYGVLRPLDALQAYRLEMGTRLANSRGKDLYAFWGDCVTQALNRQLAPDDDPVLVNLASEEYFKVVRIGVLRARVVQCVFEDFKGDGYKVIGFFAKRARGLMTRWIIDQRVSSPEDLRDFALQGYAYSGASSSADRLVFRRRVGD